METVQLLITDEPDRNALRALLEQQYDVRVRETVEPADCHITDDRTFPDYRDDLLEHKRSNHPTFTPVLLIWRGDRAATVGGDRDTTEDGITLVDDIVSAPIKKQILFRSIDNLVVRRQQSRSLARKYEASEARFEALFAAIPDMAFVLDEDDRLTAVNDEFCEVLSTTRADVVGQSLPEIDGLDIVETAPDVGGHHQADRTVRVDGLHGETRHATLSLQRVAVGGTDYTVGVLTDITELKEKTERLEEFTSIVAHDLRNPLQVAQARAEFIEDSFEECEEHFHAINRSHQRMEELTNKLMRVARTDSDNVSLSEATVGDIARQAWQTVVTNEADLVTEQAETTTVRADREQLLELFENLFRNAIEHGGDDVTVRVGTLNDGFYVEDDGPGFPTDGREKVLEMGYTTETQGTGLGLGIVTEIVDAHKWEVRVTDSTDGGARIEIYGVGETSAASSSAGQRTD